MKKELIGMKTMAFLIVALILLQPTLWAAELSVQLDNPPSEGFVQFALFDSADTFGDFRDPVKIVKQPLDGRQRYRIQKIPPGRYALLVYLDENNNLNNLIRQKFGDSRVEENKLFTNLKSLNIHNKETDTSLQILKVDPLSDPSKNDFRIEVGFKKGRENLSLQDVTDRDDVKDETKNKINDANFQLAVGKFRGYVEEV